MQIMTLYKYTREDGGVTVSPTEPIEQYTLMYRVIADEGKEVSNDGVNWAPCVDTDTNVGWNEREAAGEDGNEATEEDYRNALETLGVNVDD